MQAQAPYVTTTSTPTSKAGQCTTAAVASSTTAAATAITTHTTPEASTSALATTASPCTIRVGTSSIPRTVQCAPKAPAAVMCPAHRQRRAIHHSCHLSIPHLRLTLPLTAPVPAASGSAMRPPPPTSTAAMTATATRPHDGAKAGAANGSALDGCPTRLLSRKRQRRSGQSQLCRIDLMLYIQIARPPYPKNIEYSVQHLHLLWTAYADYDRLLFASVHPILCSPDLPMFRLFYTS